MGLLEKHPNMYRAGVVSVAALLLLTAGINFYRYARSTTDENWFRDVPSRLLVMKSIALPGGRQGGDSRDRQFAPDSILVGDLLVGAGGGMKIAEDEFDALLAKTPADSMLTLHLFRPAANRSYVARVPRQALAWGFVAAMRPAVHVFEVIEGGASDRAGMKAGDLITKINGRTFHNSFEADKVLQQAQIGKTIQYEILRNGRPLELHLTLARFGVSLPVLILFLSGRVYLAMGLALGVVRPQSVGARYLSIGFVLFSAWQLLAYNREQAYTLFSLWRDHLTLIASLTALPFWFRSTYFFPERCPALLGKKWISIVPFAIAGAGLLAKSAGVLPFAAVINLTIVLQLIFFTVVRLVFRRRLSDEYKKIARPIGRTIRAVLVLALLFQIAAMQVNPLHRGYIGLLFGIVPLVYFYTIGRYRLFDLDLRVRRDIQYSIVLLLWNGLIAIGYIYAIYRLAQVRFDLPAVHFSGGAIEVLDSTDEAMAMYREAWQRLFSILFGILITYVAWRVRGAGKRIIDEKYYQDRYDYRRAANVLSEVMSTRLEMEDLAQGIVQKLADLMNLKRVSILFYRRQSICCCREAFGIPNEEWQAVCRLAETGLLEAVRQFGSDSRISISYLPEPLREILQRTGFRHIVPIRHKSNLVAILLLGEKLSEAPFHDEDLSFLSAVAKQASVAIENSYLYEELAEQERLRHELEIARQIQLASLPQTTPQFDDIEISGISIPATEVGGDYFDYLNGAPNEVTVIVGDVSGKGTSAALYMSKVQGILRSLHGFSLSPREMFVRTNDLVYKDFEKKSFFTVIGARIDVKRKIICIARAGHLPLIRYRAETGEVEFLTPGGLGIGIDSAEIFAANLEEKSLPFCPGDVFLFITDGITEAQNNQGQEFGEEALAGLVRAHAGASAAEIRDGILQAVREFSGEALQHDDQTVVVVKVCGLPAGAGNRRQKEKMLQA